MPKYRVTFKDGKVVTVEASDERSARLAALDKRGPEDWGTPVARPISSVKKEGR